MRHNFSITILMILSKLWSETNTMHYINNYRRFGKNICVKGCRTRQPFTFFVFSSFYYSIFNTTNNRKAEKPKINSHFAFFVSKPYLCYSVSINSNGKDCLTYHRTALRLRLRDSTLSWCFRRQQSTCLFRQAERPHAAASQRDNL